MKCTTFFITDIDSDLGDVPSFFFVITSFFFQGDDLVNEFVSNLQICSSLSNMSLVGSSSSSYGNRKHYSLTGSKKKSGLSASMDSSNKPKILYGTGSDSTESYDPSYILDSPSSEVVQLVAAQQISDSPDAANINSHSSLSKYQSDDLEGQFTEAMDFDDSRMRLKLQELERELLDENDEDDSILGPNESMEIESGWADAVPNALIHDSPKESSSIDSNISSISSSKEVSLLPDDNPKQLLFDCAVTISNGNVENASTMIDELRQRVSIQGEPSERIAAYMVEALAARMATSGKGLYKALKCKEAPSLDRLSAMQVLFEVCPCFRFGFMAANGAIIEALENERKVHIVDFDINQGSQYITLLQTLANYHGKLPLLRLTGVDDPESLQRATGSLKLIGQRLEQLAQALEVPFEFQAVVANTEEVTPAILDHHPDEALVVNFAFQLHHMPDESVSTVNQRDKLLRMVKSMNPKLVTVVEQDVNTNTAPFLPRFAEAYNFYYAIFDSLDATLPRDSQDRMNVEKQCLARDIVNVVACEGEERIERYEVAGKWRARMMMAGFEACPIGQM